MNNKYTTFFIGAFDGLHCGHNYLFQKRIAPVGIMIVSDIPRKQDFLFSLKERIKQLQYFYHPADIIIYSVEKNNVPGKEFLVYLKTLNIDRIVVGKNFFFGNDHLPATELVTGCQNLEILPIQPGVSSSLIKTFLTTGNLIEANRLLLNCFFYEGKVIRGKGMSGGFSCPTANFLIPPKNIRLFSGTYASVSKVNHKFYESVTFTGSSKTFPNEPWSVQSHLFNLESKNLYGKTIRTYFIQSISDNKRFHSIDELRNKINCDVKSVQNFFLKTPLSQNKLKWKIF